MSYATCPNGLASHVVIYAVGFVLYDYNHICIAFRRSDITLWKIGVV
jgi:hypothetical protein